MAGEQVMTHPADILMAAAKIASEHTAFGAIHQSAPNRSARNKAQMYLYSVSDSWVYDWGDADALREAASLAMDGAA